MNNDAENTEHQRPKQATNHREGKHAETPSGESNTAGAENPSMGIWEWCLKKDNLLLDDRSRDLLGGDPDDAEAFFDLIHPEDRQPVRQSLDQTLDTEQDFHSTFRVKGGDRNRRIEIAGRVACGPHGEPDRLIGTMRDHPRADDSSHSDDPAREHQHTNFRRAVESTGHGVMMTDPDGVITYVNPAFQQMSGYERSELEGAKPRILNSGQHDDAFFQNLWETITAGNVWKGEIINRRESGELYHAQQTIAPVVDDRGEVQSYISIQEDITDQKQRKQELLEKSRAIQNSPIGIVLADATKPDDPLCYVNDGFEELTGYEKEEILGRNCRFLQGEKTDPEKVNRIREAIANEEMVKIELRNYRKNGEMFWNQLIISPIRNREGDVTRFVGYQQDVTQRKCSEQQLQIFRDSINKSPQEIFILDPDTARFLDLTDSVPDDLGYSRDELLNMTASDVNPDVGDTLDWDELVREMKRNGSIRLESRHRRKDGSTFPVEIHADHVVVDGTARIVASAQDISERLEKKRKIERQAKLLNRINDRMPGISYQFRRDADGSYSFPYMSKGFEQLAGISSIRAREDCENAIEQIHPEDRPAFLDSIEQSAETMTPWKFEWRFTHPEGDVTWVRGSSLPDKQPDGSIVWTGVLIDITDEKERYRELNVQKQRFQTLFDNAPIGLWEEDWSGVKSMIEQLPFDDPDDLENHLNDHPEMVRELSRNVDVILPNETVVEMTGARDKQHLMNDFEEILTKETYSSFRDEVLGLLRGETSLSSSMSIRRFDGEERKMLRDFQLVPGHESDWSRVFVSYRDITERVEIQETLRRSEQRYRTLFEEANEAFIVKSLDDQILAANQSACELLGYDRDELIGMNSSDIRPSDMVEERSETGIVQSILDEHGESLFLTEYLHRDGTRVPVEAKFQRFTYDENTSAVMACVRDRSELEQIREESNRKSSFVSRVTHDLRTPLNSILGMGQLLMETDLDPEQQERLRVMLNATRSMERLTNDILDLDRIEQGKINLEKSQFNVRNLLGEVLSLYSERVRDRNLMLSTRIEDEVPELLIGDANRLKQILHNLVENAVKHTQEGTICLSVDTKNREDLKTILEFSVSDTGSGIPEDQLSTIFDRGKQVGTNGSSSSGIGLGLSICQTFVELMNGEMTVESEVDEGTTFTFTAEFVEGVARTDVSLDNTTVLIVDDNEHVLNVFRTYLEAHDINVIPCTTGASAREELLRTNEDGVSPLTTVFLDHRLEDMSGIDLLREINTASDAVQSERVYIVTGDPREKIQEELEDIDVAGVLEKPISESTMITAMTNIIERDLPATPNHPDPILDAIKTQYDGPLDILLFEDTIDTQHVLSSFLDPITDQMTILTEGEDAIEQYKSQRPDLILMDIELAGTINGIETTERIRTYEQEHNLDAVPIICQTALAMTHVEQRCYEAGADAFIRQPLERIDLYQAILTVLQDQTEERSDSSPGTS